MISVPYIPPPCVISTPLLFTGPSDPCLKKGAKLIGRHFQKTVTFILDAHLTCSWIALSGEIQIPYHEAALWKNSFGKRSRPASNQENEFGSESSIIVETSDESAALPDSLITTS